MFRFNSKEVPVRQTGCYNWIPKMSLWSKMDVSFNSKHAHVKQKECYNSNDVPVKQTGCSDLITNSLPYPHFLLFGRESKAPFPTIWRIRIFLNNIFLCLTATHTRFSFCPEICTFCIALMFLFLTIHVRFMWGGGFNLFLNRVIEPVF